MYIFLTLRTPNLSSRAPTFNTTVSVQWDQLKDLSHFNANTHNSVTIKKRTHVHKTFVTETTRMKSRGVDPVMKYTGRTA
jgi:hypothetical protein